MDTTYLHIRIRPIPSSDEKEWGIFNEVRLQAKPVNGWWFHDYRLAHATMELIR